MPALLCALVWGPLGACGDDADAASGATPTPGAVADGRDADGDGTSPASSSADEASGDASTSSTSTQQTPMPTEDGAAGGSPEQDDDPDDALQTAAPRCRHLCESRQDCCTGDDCAPEIACSEDGRCITVQCEQDQDCLALGGAVCAQMPTVQGCTLACDDPLCRRCEEDLAGRPHCTRAVSTGSCGGGPCPGEIDVNPGDLCRGLCEGDGRGSLCLEETLSSDPAPACGCNTDGHCATLARLGRGARCVVEAGLCGCSTDADCSESLHGPRCDPTLRVCTCGADDDCDPEPYAQLGGRVICEP